MITKIVTARNVYYSVGGIVDGKGIEVIVSDIEPVFADDVSNIHYIVTLSDGTWVEVKDVVEIWREKDS